MVKLISPKNNEIVSLVNEQVRFFYDSYQKQKKLIKNDYELNGYNWGLNTVIKVDDIYKTELGKYNFESVKFVFESNNRCKLCLALDSKFKNKVLNKYSTNGTIEIFNLERNQTYYWKVVDLVTNEESEIRSFKTADYPRLMKFEKMLNVRDFGGYSLENGGILRQNLIFRGCEIVNKTYRLYSKLQKNQVTHVHARTATKKAIEEMRKYMKNGIEIDLRGDEEANYITESPLNNEKCHVDFVRLSLCAYDDAVITEDQNIIEHYRKIFEIFADYSGRPIYVHCWGGADRTGTLFFLLGGLLGMCYTDLVVEYEITTFAGNERVHYAKPKEYSWMRYVELIEELEKYRDKNHIENNLSKIIEHLLINKYGISNEIISKIKETYILN